jgi:hypothetical protein
MANSLEAVGEPDSGLELSREGEGLSVGWRSGSQSICQRLSVL